MEKEHKNGKKVSIQNSGQKMSQNSRNAVQTFNLTAKEKKTIFRMLCIVGVLYLTSIPAVSTFMYEVVHGHDETFDYYLYPWAATAMFLCGVINPYIYCYRNDHFRIRKPAPKRPPVLSSFNTSSERFQHGVSHLERACVEVGRHGSVKP